MDLLTLGISLVIIFLLIGIVIALNQINDGIRKLAASLSDRRREN